VERLGHGAEDLAHAGCAAQSGLLAAQLVSRGFTAPQTILEGRRGFGAVLSSQHDFARATDALGTRWEIHNNGLKPYACGVVTHPLIDACRALCQEAGVTPDAIEKIEARVHPLVLELTNRPEIATGLEGKFSVQHCVAAALVDGTATPDQFTDAKATDPTLAALRRKVTLTEDESLAEEAATVRLTLRNGRTLERHVPHATGSPRNPLTDAQLNDKFRALASRTLAASRLESLLESLWRLEQLTALPDLSA
jgi:2-methylcitrate dehydratase PrpD